MKKLIFLFLLLTSFLTAQVMWQIKKDTVVKWYYQEGDEFDSNSVNTSYWKYVPSASHNIYTNKEQQYYTQGDNHIMSNGTLKLIAKKEPAMRITVDGRNENDSLIENKKFYGINKQYYYYTSGQVETIKSFAYGFFECRFKLPKEKGYWPAIWLHGGDPNEEIDLMEGKGERPKSIHIDTHCPNRCDQINLMFQKRSFGGWVKTKYDFTQEFNVIACDWDTNEVRFYLNGESIGISKVKFNLEKFFTLNLAIPSNNGPFKPGPNKKDSVDVSFEIDYFRIWKKDQNNKSKTIKIAIFKPVNELSKPLLCKSSFKSKSKLVYGNKKDHTKEGVFITYLNTNSFIQVTALGKFGNEKFIYQIFNADKKEIKTGKIDQQIFTIQKTGLSKGEYDIVINYKDTLLKQSFLVD